MSSPSIVQEDNCNLPKAEINTSAESIIKKEFPAQKNPKLQTPTRSSVTQKENITNSSIPNLSSHTDSIQQKIQNNYKEFLAQKNLQLKTLSTSRINSPVLVQPIGINNISKNCWCISVLQILCNTPLYEYIISSDSNLQKGFPKLFEFIKTYKEKSESSEHLGTKIKEIRVEVNKHLGKNFVPSEETEADAITFILELFEKLNLSYYITGITASRNDQIKDSIIKREEPCIFIEPQKISSIDLDIEEIFDSTPYELIAVLRAEPAHYSSLIKSNDGYWYKCNDNKVSQLLRVFQTTMLENDHRTFLIGYRKNS
ncbi:MAG: hypothetical protein ACRCSV_03635 [Chlamydiales bacterium]